MKFQKNAVKYIYSILLAILLPGKYCTLVKLQNIAVK